MKFLRALSTMLLILSSGLIISAQERKAANPAAVPPNLLVLIHREIQSGRSPERQKLGISLARACDRLEAPGFWINLQSMTGSREEVSLDLYDSFEHWEDTHADWKKFYAAHPDLTQIRGEINALVVSERTMVALRRDDLSHFVEDMDLSEARFVRMVEVRLFPGHDSDFAEAIKLWNEAHLKSQTNRPTAVYQVSEGAAVPTFLMLLPMAGLKDNEDLLSERQGILQAPEGDASADRLKQIARESVASTESNIYAISPEISHVPKDFATSDTDFWRPGRELETKPKPAVSPTRGGEI